MNDKFHLLVRSREGVVFEGNVDSITSFNEQGKFDILAKHANFISLIQKKIIIRDEAGKQKEIQVSNALLRMKTNKAEIYLGVEGRRLPELGEVASENEASRPASHDVVSSPS